METASLPEIVSRLQIGICMLDSNLRIAYANPAMCALLSCNATNINGQTLAQCFSGELLVLLEKAIVAPEKFSAKLGKWRFKTPAGKIIWIRIKLQHIETDKNSTSTLLVIEDISGFVEKVLDLETSSERLSALFQFSKDIIFIVNRNLKIVLINHLDRQTQKGDISGTSIRTWFQIPSELTVAEEAYHLTFENGLSTNYIITSQADQQTLIYACTVSPIWKDGQIEEAVCIARLVQPHTTTDKEKAASHGQELAAHLDQLHWKNALRASEEKFRSLFAQSTVAEFEFHKYSHQLSFNGSAREILKIPESVEMIDIAPRIFAEKLLPGGLEEVLKTQNVIRLQTEFSPSHYRERYNFPTLLTENILLDIAIVPIIPKNETRPLSFLVQMLDITEKHKAEKELKAAFEELKQLRARLEEENVYLREEAALGANFADIIYAGSKLQEVLSEVEQVATTNATVLILGETGTGKELIAKAIHNISPRKARPLIKLNCAALPKELIESELFGHEKGAFTGAVSRKIGRFELADGGTIFLDEIGELPLELQPKLLRVLQEGEFERLGGTETKKIDVRVVAATNRDLQAEMKNGNFRMDLYYRLNVFPVTMPPLRDRKEDIPALVAFFVKKFNQKFQKSIVKVPERLMQWMQFYEWPGNVRELENLIERAMILAKTNVLPIDSFPLAEISGEEALEQSPEKLNEVKRLHILKVLKQHDWVINGELGAAKALGLKPSTLRDQMRLLGIRRPTKAE